MTVFAQKSCDLNKGEKFAKNPLGESAMQNKTRYLRNELRVSRKMYLALLLALMTFVATTIGARAG